VLDDFIHTQRGDALAAAGDWQGALAAYQAALQAGAPPDALAFKIGEIYTAEEDYNSAVRVYMSLYESSNNDYTKAEADLRAGQTYLQLELPEQAYARFNDAVHNYPRAYASYLALIALLDAGQPVSDFDRGLVDYFAGQYGLSAEAFLRYLAAEPNHEGSAHHYLALALLKSGQPEAAINAWQILIRDHPDDLFWAQAWDEISTVQAQNLGDTSGAAQTLLNFVAQNKQAAEAPAYLFDAARLQERAGRLSDAAQTWERILNEYPTAPEGYRALFLAGITRYRLGDYANALTIFQRTLTLASESEDQAMSRLWIGKTQQALGNQAEAESAWRMAAAADPTGYYSERAAQLLRGEQPFTPPKFYDLSYSLEADQPDAENWLRRTFNLPPETNLTGLGELSSHPLWQRGQAFWELGLYAEANDEFEQLRLSVQNDPVASYHLLNGLLQHGMYRSAILTSRQILDLANLSDATTLTAPRYFNRVRFGAYYPELVMPAAQRYGLNPLLLLSVIRQESFFQSFSRSSAGARGPMQIMPATGAEIAAYLGWPQGYTADDLYRPVINIPFGASYLARQQRAFEGDLYTALAAYNGGPGNAAEWQRLSQGDPDLFVEVIRFNETRDYVRRVAENFFFYSTLYQRAP
jgi:soluble lytic murein transglycosylase